LVGFIIHTAIGHNKTAVYRKNSRSVQAPLQLTLPPFFVFAYIGQETHNINYIAEVYYMGFGFRKSIKLGKGIRVNVGKRGLSLSTGVKGFRVGVGSRGLRTTASIPGTGLYYTKTYSMKHKKSSTKMVSDPGPAIKVSYADTLLAKKPTKGSGWVTIAIISFIASFSGIFAVVSVPLLIISIIAIVRFRLSDSNKSIIAYNKAVSEYKKTDIDKAIEFLEESLYYNPENIDSLSFLGVLYHDNKHDYYKAEEVFSKIIELNPEHTTSIVAKISLADTYIELYQYDKAIEILQKLDLKAYESLEWERAFMLGQCYFKKGQYALAVEQFKKGPYLKRNIDEDVLRTKYWLGVSYFHLGDKKKARTYLATVYAEDSQYEDIERYAAQLQF